MFKAFRSCTRKKSVAMTKSSDLNDSYYLISYRHKRNSKYFYTTAFLTLVLLVALLYGALFSWYMETNMGQLCNEIKAFDNVCSDIPDEKKVDCYPDHPVTADLCFDRGCCFSVPKTNPDLPLSSVNVPYCFYPTNYIGYAVINVTETVNRIKVKLKRFYSSGFPGDVQNLDLLIIFIEDYIIRLKVNLNYKYFKFVKLACFSAHSL